MSGKSSAKGSAIARRTASRLAAVQAVYQMWANEQGSREVVGEYLSHRFGKPVEGHTMVVPDEVLFSKIVSGVDTRMGDLEGIIDASLAPQDDAKARHSFSSLEPLLRSVLLCGVYELLAHHDIDMPVIISDYLDVTHAFYEGGEPKLVNAVLDRAGRSVRDMV